MFKAPIISSNVPSVWWMLYLAGMRPFLNKKIMFLKRNFQTISINAPICSADLNGNN